MSIEQKIAEILAESKAGKFSEENTETVASLAAKAGPVTQNPDNAKNAVDDEDEATGGTSKTKNVTNKDEAAGEASRIAGMKEDMDALFNGEELSEEFRTKASTIFEAAVMNRVNQEVTRIEEEFNAELDAAMESNVEGLVEQVDGYLGYIAEQWITQNEIALEHGMKSEILEGFVSGLKQVFEEHYIDIPEDKYDILAEMEERMADLEERLNEQVDANIELTKGLVEATRAEIVSETSEGLTDTEAEKLQGLSEELSYEDAETFTKKLQTIRESYFTTKAQADVRSVVTDAPVDMLTEEKRLDPTMARYLGALTRK